MKLFAVAAQQHSVRLFHWRKISSMREIVVKLAAVVITIILFYGVVHQRDLGSTISLLALTVAYGAFTFTVYLLFDRRIQSWPLYRNISTRFDTSRYFQPLSLGGGQSVTVASLCFWTIASYLLIALFIFVDHPFKEWWVSRYFLYFLVLIFAVGSVVLYITT
jgi:hypothetical protein